MSSDHTGATAEFDNGDALCQGRFIVDRFISSGGVGAAYLVRDTLLDHDLVVKIAHESDDLAWSEMRLQFSKLSRIASRDVVTPLGFFAHPGGTRGRPAIALEWVDGVDFEVWVETPDGESIEQRIRAIARMAHALAELHGEGLAHGDLYGGNVRVTADRVVLIDVGSEASSGNSNESDRKSLALIITRFLTAYSKGVLAGIVDGLTSAGGRRLSMQDVAAQLTSLSMNTPLIDTSAPFLGAAAAAFKEEMARREQRYQFVRIQRALTIERLAARIHELSIPFGLPINDKSVAAPAEEQVRGRSEGSFLARSIAVSSPRAPNMRWHVMFDAVAGFSKPMPYGNGVIAQGVSWVASDFRRYRDDVLQVRLEDDVPQIYVTPRPDVAGRGRVRDAHQRGLGKRVGTEWVVVDDKWLLECLSALTGQPLTT